MKTRLLLAAWATVAVLVLATTAAQAKHVVFMIGEREYKTAETLPAFFASDLKAAGHTATFIHADKKDKNHFPGITEALKKADVLLISVRRRALPAAQLDAVKAYIAAGKPVIAIRTASHAFDTKGKIPKGGANWADFDKAVLGGNYHGHYGRGAKAKVAPSSNAVAKHALLEGISTPFVSPSHLYKNKPLAESARAILTGTLESGEAHPVAWTRGSSVFATSLGGPEDFENPAFRRLLTNAVSWVKTAPSPHAEGGGGPLSFSVKDIEGKKVDLARYKGKVVLFVNVASRCGATPQYAGLQKLHEAYAAKGLAILGFPCNQFGKQEPGTDGQIAAFCDKEYGVKFDMFSKIDVNGAGADPLYQYLTSDKAPIADKGKVKWNFEKFLVGRNGQVIARFRTRVKPAQFETQVKQALEAKAP